MEIGAAAVSDLDEIVACAELAFADSGKSFDSSVTYNCRLASQILEGSIYVIRHDLIILGYISQWPISDHLFIETLAVLPAHQCYGVGSQLLQFAEDEASRRELLSVRFFTKGRMARSIAFYRNRGYVETDRCDEDGYCRVFYCKKIATATSAPPETGKSNPSSSEQLTAVRSVRFS